jgi:hypothetical protein
LGIKNYNDFCLKGTRFEGNLHFFEMEECGGDKNWIEVIKKCEHSICSPLFGSPNQKFLMKIIFKKINSCFDVER